MNDQERPAASGDEAQSSSEVTETQPTSGVGGADDAAAVASTPPPPPPLVEPQGLSQVARAPEERKALLANALQGQVAGGARIESQGEFQAVVVRGHRPNHLLHFLIGVFTLGLWWIVWFFIAVFGGEKRQMVSVDDFGNVLVQKV